MKDLVSTFLTGLAMGAANVVPGVSGGTVALIAGIYERLIGAIRAFDLEALQLLRRGEFAALRSHLDARWLGMLLLGVTVSIVSLARLFEYLLEAHERLTMAFFFGLILLSVLYVARTVTPWNAGAITALAVGTVIAVSVALLAPAAENASPAYVFLCGMVAISSMILPGLSGSFVLIMMGNYVLVLGAINRFEFGILLPLAAGCAVGLVVFSHVLTWVFRHHERATLATMTGFVLGSLVVIWPWKTPITETVTPPGGEPREILQGYDWFWPDLATTNTWAAFAMIALGMLAIAFMERRAGLQAAHRED